MQIDPRLLITLVAAQSFLMGGLLLAIVSGRGGKAASALAMRGVAMLLQGVGYVLVAQRGHLAPVLTGPLSFGLVALGHGITLVALRILLGIREYRWPIAAVLAIVWIVMLFPSWLVPDPPAARSFSQIYSIGYAIAVSWPLVPRLRWSSSTGEKILLGTAVFMAATQVWWLIGGAGPAASSIVMLLTALMPTLTGVAFLMMYQEVLHADLRRLARIDPLTGVGNRRALVEHLKRELARAAAASSSVALLIIDVDRFKQVNDRFGHVTGDRLLRDIARRLASTLSRTDMLGRLGGEEFVVVARGIDLSEAAGLGERLRSSIEASTLRVGDHLLSPTVSIGVAVSLPGESEHEAILDRADRALYEAKYAGRNRVVVWSREHRD